MTKFNVLKLFAEEFVQSGKITVRERDFILIGFIENKSNVVGAFELFMAMKN